MEMVTEMMMKMVKSGQKWLEMVSQNWKKPSQD